MRTKSIDDHAELIAEQIHKSLEDPATRRLAASLVSGTYDWIRDPRTNKYVAAVEYHSRFYKVAPTGKRPGVCRPRDYDCEVVAIWNFLVLNVRYTNDSDGMDVYQDLRTILETGSGDCDDASVAACALFKAVGYRCALRIISQDSSYWSHVYPLIEQPKRGWVALDMTEDGKFPGWEYGGAKSRVDFIVD